MVGLSGLGKTSLALEAFRPPTDPSAEPALAALSNRVVYLRNPGSDIVPQVIDWRNRNVDGLLIVDDCDHDLHALLAQEIKHSASRLSLLTLDFVADEKTDSTDPILILKESTPEVIRGILKQTYTGLLDMDLDRIVEFAQGFPQMAVLLADARLQDLPDMGSLNNDDLVRRLLWGHGAPNEEQLRVVEACALFEVLGVDGTVIDQLKFVAKEFCDDKFQTFYNRLATFADRGIIERRGDYVRVRPKPLAVRLAADWWRKCHPQEAARLFQLEMPEQLIEALCSRLAMLDFVPEAREIAAALCGDSGPFGQAEVLNSERGSRCFCSIVEVNPFAALSALTRSFGSWSRDELSTVVRGRRHLIWSLQKLCCRRQTFEGAATLLLAFAGAENERWANNATGSFLQLFNIYLSGTEVPAIDRLVVPFKAITSEVNEVQRLGVRALGRALEYGPFTRFSGIEFQGGGAPIQDWRPQRPSDITDYWDSAESELIQVAASTGGMAQAAAEELVNHIRGHIAAGRIDHVESWIHHAILLHTALWPRGLDQLQQARQYEGPTMPPTTLSRVEKLVEQLQPKDLPTRIRLFVSVPPFEHVQRNDGTFRYLDREKAESFAEECAASIQDFLPLIRLLVSGEQRQAFPFGAKLALLVPEPKKLISAASDALRETPTKGGNPGLIAGILHGLQTKDGDLVQSTLDEFAQDARLCEYAVHLTQSIRMSGRDLDRLLNLAKKQKIAVRDLSSLGYGQALAHFSFEQLETFLRELAALGLEGARAAFEIAFFYALPKKLAQSDFRPLIREILLLAGILANEVSNGTHHAENFLDVASQFLVNASEQALAKKLMDEAITMCEEDNSPYGLMRSFKSLLAAILKNHPAIAWERIAQSIIGADPLKKFRLQHLLGRGFESSEPRLVSELPLDLLLSWCKAHPDTGPQFLAGILQPPEKTDDQVGWSPAMLKVLQNFGDKEGVLEELGHNMGTFSSVGSAAGYYQSFLIPLEKLLSHRSKRVSKWASRQLDWHRKMIAEERKRDEEREFGIYR